MKQHSAVTKIHNLQSVHRSCTCAITSVQGEGRAVGCASVAVGAGICQQGPEQDSSGESCPRRARFLQCNDYCGTTNSSEYDTLGQCICLTRASATGLHLPGGGDKQKQQLVTVEHLVRSHWAKCVLHCSVGLSCSALMACHTLRSSVCDAVVAMSHGCVCCSYYRLC